MGGWNIFAGLNFTFGPILFGVEVKYLDTAKAKTARGQSELEGASLLANLGLRF